MAGYRVGVTEDQLNGAPKYNRNTEWDWSERHRDKAIYDYYRAPLWYACVIRMLGECRPAFSLARRLAAVTTNAPRFVLRWCANYCE